MRLKKISAGCVFLGLVFALRCSQWPAGAGEVSRLSGLDWEQLKPTHDIVDLPAWGPYSKTYAGISHIPDMKKGLRFDVSLLPGFYGGDVLIPNVDFISGYYPWNINSNLTQLTYRYELEWKDRVYVDATYSVLASNLVGVAFHCVNHTPLPQNLALNLTASISYPENYPVVQAGTAGDTRWINAMDYQTLEYAHPRHDNNLVYDGWMRGETRKPDYVDSRAIGRGFGHDRGDKVSYQIVLDSPEPAGEIVLRYRLKKEGRVRLHFTGLMDKEIELNGSGNFELQSIPFSSNTGGTYPLSIESEGGAEMELNGFFVQTAGGEKGEVLPQAMTFVPKVVSSDAHSLILKYQDIGNCYGLAWDFPQSVRQEFQNDELDIFFRKNLQNHVSKKFVGNQLGDYQSIFMRPVEIAPESERTVHAVIGNGTAEEVRRNLSAFLQSSADTNEAPPENAGFRENEILPEGRGYIFSQNMMWATLLGNLVYPIYTQGSYIRHFTPGKWWNSLYTWDSGFIALGLLEVNPKLAVECLNAYTTPPGSQSAFIEHGSVVPVQIFAFWDLWNRTQSKELLTYMYPRLKQYYDFVSGRSEGSTTRTLPSNLLKTWDYFYSSGGWDDYPAQVAMHDRHLEKNTAPVITTAQCIREAKMLRIFAEKLALPKDIAAYDQDITTFSNALQKYAWDPKSGYYSYVTHDSAGQPDGFLTYGKSGVNYNEGLDGAYPLTSGICTPEQQEILLQKIFSPTNMWTPSGICVVDQSAPYFRNDGYANGTVWMPHQWFMWKTMLDLGRADLALKIARKGLDVWKTETDYSYFTYEHFLTGNGRGTGWHQFSSLSTPVLSWFVAYYKQGTATAGFETLIDEQRFAADNSGYQAQLIFDQATSPHTRCLIVCLNPDYKYRATYAGRPLSIDSPYPGLLQIELPETNDRGELIVSHL